jgi:hypothetical protein
MKLYLRISSKRTVIPAKQFLTAQAIFDQATIQENGKDILKLIQSNEFCVWYKDARDGAKKREQERKAIAQLSSLNCDEWVSGLLEIIYGIRCNMVHGEKDFRSNQKRILKPCICVIEKLNDLIIEKFQNDDANSATCSPRENAL